MTKKWVNFISIWEIQSNSNLSLYEWFLVIGRNNVGSYRIPVITDINGLKDSKVLKSSRKSIHLNLSTMTRPDMFLFVSFSSLSNAL